MITTEEFYKRLENCLRAQGHSLESYSLVIGNIINKKVFLRNCKSRKSFPTGQVIPFIDFNCFTEDELYYIATTKLSNINDEDSEDYKALEEFIAELEPSKEYLAKQRLKRKMQREVTA